MNNSTTGFDYIVIGAGIAGASVAAELASDRRVLLLERESQPGYHTTGRSAALFTVTYGPEVIRALSRASAAFFHDPASPHLAHPLLEPRGAVFVARQDQQASLARTAEELGLHVTPLSGAEVETRVPLLRKGYATGGLQDASAADIDVNGLHQHYLKTFRAGGGVLQTKAEVQALRKEGDWQVDTNQGTFYAPVIVNAAGAWADEIATLAGLKPAGLTPKRRTALTVAPPEGMVPDRWPMVVDIDEQFYLKADAGKLLISPADATPSPPATPSPRNWTSRSASTGSKPPSTSNAPASKAAGPGCAASCPMAIRWRDMILKVKGSSGSLAKAAMASRPPRRSPARRRHWCGARKSPATSPPRVLLKKRFRGTARGWFNRPDPRPPRSACATCARARSLT